MRLASLLSLLALSLPADAAEKKTSSSAPVSIRLHAEGKQQDSETFVTPVMLINPPKQIFISKVPIITERDITAFYPFAARDGTIGCYFRLDADGTNKLIQHTVAFRDTLVIAMVNGRVASAMNVTTKITDGIMPIPSGFLPQEIVQLQTKYPMIGKEKEFSKQKKQAEAVLKEARKNAVKPTPTPKPGQ